MPEIFFDRSEFGVPSSGFAPMSVSDVFIIFLFLDCRRGVGHLWGDPHFCEKMLEGVYWQVLTTGNEPLKKRKLVSFVSNERHFAEGDSVLEASREID